MLLQAFDFLELYKKFGVQLQMGGSDQWGNIVNGIDLIRRVAQQESFGITSPLLVTADNKKMGKTEKGAIWLKASMLSPYEFWQFWRNVADADAIRFLKLFTELPIDEIERLEQLKGQEINEAKKILATHVTALAHGKQAAELAEITALQTFEQQKDSDTLPTICISRDAFTKNQTLAHFLVTAQLCPSIKQAKRLVEGGGVRINGSHIDKSSMPITENNIQNGCIRVSIGKKQHVIVKLANTL
jgi:tyrosyl-tRNA synthetase